MPPFQPVSKYIQSKNYIEPSKKYTTEPAKVHLSSVNGNHKKSFNHEKHRKDTELSKAYWRLKELKAQPQVQFSILKRCRPIKRTCICYLCLNKKLFINEHQGNNLLNKRNELISKCRHKNKFKFMNHKAGPLCENCPCSELFSGANFFPAFGLNMETYGVSSHVHSNPECKHFSRS